MPQKHSKNANSSSKFHRREFQYAREGGYGSQFGSWHDGWQGTLEQRLGSDAHMPFGYCSLSLQQCVDPMATPSGHMYSREYIMEYLLAKKKDIQRQTKLYDAQQAKLAADKTVEAETARENSLQDFIDCQESITDRSAQRVAGDGKELLKQMIGGKRDGVSGELTEKRKKFLNSTFWVPDSTPDNVSTAIQKPEKRPRSPMSGEPLKLKDLIPLDILKLENDSGEAEFLCAVSKKELKHQKVVLIRSSGQVMLKKCFDELAKPEMKCPVTGKSFTDSDVIELRTGGTGFSAHNDVIAKRYRPSM